MEAFLYVAAFTIGAYIFASQEPPAFKPSRPSYDEERPSGSFEKPPLRKRGSSTDLKQSMKPIVPVSSPSASSGFARSDPIDIPKKKKKQTCNCALT